MSMNPDQRDREAIETENYMDEFSEQLIACFEEIAILQETSEAVGRLMDRSSIAEAALAACLRVSGAPRGAFFTIEDDGWKRLAAIGELAGDLPADWASILPERQKPYIQNRPGSGALGDLEVVGPGISTLLAAPLAGAGRLVGAVVLADAGRGQFESSDAKMIHAIARQAAMALNNEEHHRWLMAAQEEILVSQKFAAMGEMAAEIGHELNNYLTSILGQTEIAQVLMEGGSTDGLDKRLRTIISQVDKMSVLTKGLLKCSKQDMNPQECRVDTIIQEAIAFVSPQNRFDYTEFKVSLADDLPLLRFDPNQIQQVFLNLFTNAADAMGGKGGTISISASRISDPERVEIRVSDEGPGVPEDLRHRIFEPRFTTKNQGNGFGLAVCFRIVEDHGGSIRIVSDNGPGAAFMISFPVAGAQESSPITAASRPDFIASPQNPDAAFLRDIE
ncbi:MAG: GAF domain-containing protein [Candidatus Eisenbacteria sp.]|nr:GAF domain-containing protein [Candidatus Eisenbacteria bacterium]